MTLPCFKECNTRLVLSLRLVLGHLTEVECRCHVSVISFALLWAGLGSFGVSATSLHGAVYLQKPLGLHPVKNFSVS